MKTILVPTEDHDSMAAVLHAAWLVARRFDSYVAGFAVQPAASEFVALDPLSSLTVPQIADGDAEIEHDSRQMFESFMASNNVTTRDSTVAGAAGAIVLRVGAIRRGIRRVHRQPRA